VRRTLLILIAALLSNARVLSTQTSPERALVEDAAKALGGRERILSVRTILIQGEGVTRVLGQDLRPEAIDRGFRITGYRRALDLQGKRFCFDQTQTPDFPYFNGQDSVRIATKFHLTGPATSTDLARHPFLIIRAALDPATPLTSLRSKNGENLVDIALPQGPSFTLAVDSRTRLPSRIFSTTSDANLGDVVVETTFSDYQVVRGIKLPARLTTKTDKVVTEEIRITRQAIDDTTAFIDFPAPPPPQPPFVSPAGGRTFPPFFVPAEELAPGVWVLGRRMNSLLVEFKDHLMLVEAPNEFMTLAMIAKARVLRPGKPLTEVVNTHYHFDHSGGLRAAVSEGLRIIAHESLEAFVEDIVKRPHTIVPDALAKNPKPLDFRGVGDETTLTDGTMTVKLYAVEGNPHGENMIIVYLPKERILVEADMYAPILKTTTFAPNLLENIRRLRLDVDRLLPVHGYIVPFADFVRAAEATPKR
jgi:glyoxylase-like metal-dependent hydrolase (beta-lactamase superfamily II)